MARYARVSTVSCGGAGKRAAPEETIAANREAQLRLVEQALYDQPDVVCLTEVITWYGLDKSALALAAEPLDGPTVGSFADVARKHGTYIVLPLYTKEDGEIFNSAILLDRRGEVAAVYHKIHPTIGEIEMGVTPGTETVVAETDFGRVGFAICYDLNFRDVGEGNRDGGAELVFFPSMYRGGLQLSIWAHDLSFFVAAATPGDGSRIIDPLGRVLIESEVGYQRIVSRRLNLDFRVLHLDYNGQQLAELKRRYGSGVEIDVARPEAVFCLYSHLEGKTCDDLMAEMGWETRADYFRRANRVRAAALRRRK